MDELPEFSGAMAAIDEGRYDMALDAVLAAFERIDSGHSSRPRLFFTMFAWGQLSACYRPARAALMEARNAQLRRVLDGDDELALEDERPAQSRAMLVIDMNQTLGDLQSSYDMFVALHQQQPELARRIAFVAMPAILEAGDFALAEQLAPDPMRSLASLNLNAAHLPLLPPERQAPRLALDLSSFARELRERAQALRGLGRAPQADALCQAALEGLANDELRRLARLELDDAGAIHRILAEHQERHWRPAPD